MFQFLYTWFLRAAWAPIAVVLVQQIVARFYDIDWLMHFFGGAAMAFFFYQGLLLWESSIGRLLPIVRHLLAFGLTCGVVIAGVHIRSVVRDPVSSKYSRDNG